MKQLYVVILCFSLVTSLAISQESESIKPLRIGVKVGTPSIATLNAEYVTPLLNNRIGVTLDYLPLNITADDISLKIRNLEIGTTIYLNDTGKGLYASLSYFNFNTSANVTEVEFDDFTVGDGTTSLEFGTFNVKLGVKLGRVFYSRFELGYAFGALPNELIIESTEGSQTTTEPIEDIPVLGASGFPIFNFGFGISFL